MSSEVQPETYAREEGGARELCPEESGTKQIGTENYKRTFTTYYARLCDALCSPIAQILPELVSSKVFTVHEGEEIGGERTSIEKARALLSKHIFRRTSAGCSEVLARKVAFCDVALSGMPRRGAKGALSPGPQGLEGPFRFQLPIICLCCRYKHHQFMTTVHLAADKYQQTKKPCICCSILVIPSLLLLKFAG